MLARADRSSHLFVGLVSVFPRPGYRSVFRATPAEDVYSALIKSSKGLTVPIPGIGEVTLDGRGIRQFSREVKADKKPSDA